jgi:hypothetical protein
MTSHQQVWLDVLESVSPAAAARDTGSAPSWAARLRARLFAARYDREIEAGVSPAAGSPLAAHWMRLTSDRERQDLAFGLCKLAREAESAGAALNSRIPIRAAAVRHASTVIDDVLERLTGPAPVRARGMARLRILLSDGRGPVYRAGQGTISAAMRGALATL